MSPLAIAGGGAFDMGLFSGAGGGAAAGGGLPESYWSMLADAGGATDAAGAAAGTIGNAGGGMNLADIYSLIGETPPVSNPFDLYSTGTNFGTAAENAIGSMAPNLSTGIAGGATSPAANSLYSTLTPTSNSLLDLLNSPNLLRTALGAGTQALSSYLASDALQKGGSQANDTLWKMYEQSRADQTPYREAGYGALANLLNLTTPGKQLDTMMLDPGYQFRLAEGQNALDNRLKAGGKFYSGTALKAGTDYNQNFASNEFGNVYNRLAGLAGTGQTAATTTGQFGKDIAKAMAGIQTEIGDARASGYVGVGNALTGGLSAYNTANQFDSFLDLIKKASERKSWSFV